MDRIIETFEKEEYRMARKADIDFEQLFKAHDTIRDLGCRIENMYCIAAETGSKEEIADAAAEMHKHINELFLRRARFDLFCFRELDTRERKVLELRCEKCISDRNGAGGVS